MLLLPLALLAALAPSTSLLCIGVAAVVFVLAVADAWMGRSAFRGIQIDLPEIIRFSKDKPGDVEVRIRNKSLQKKRLRIGLLFPPEIQTSREDLLLALPEGSEHSRAAWECTPLERGKYLFDRCYAETPSPLGLWDMRTSLPVHSEWRVYPNLMNERKQLAAVFLNRGDHGMHAQRMVGQGREFEKLRDYVAGDSYDQLHWKATAKRGKPVTKIFQVERTQEIYVVIDHSRLTAKEIRSESVLEHYLKAALLLGLVAQRQGDLFGLVTFADKVQGFLRASNGKSHFHACRDAIYMLQPQIVTPDFDELCAFLRVRLRRRALIVMLTDLSDPLLAESFAKSSLLISRQHLVLLNMVRPTGAEPLFSHPNADTLDALYENLGGHIQWQNLRELRKVLHRQGVTLHQLDDTRMSGELITQYLSVKQRQIL